MWPKIEKDLADLLKKKTFPSLRGIPAYDKLLTPSGLPNPKACEAAAHEILTKTDLQSGIRELGSREQPTVLEWSRPICRAVAPGRNPEGYWWFDEELVQRWSRNYPPGTPGRKQKILESIRPMLAVCFDWNDFTDLRFLKPISIPVITGQGNYKPIYSDKDPRHADHANVFFIGGFKQVFVPFLKPGSSTLYPL